MKNILKEWLGYNDLEHRMFKLEAKHFAEMQRLRVKQDRLERIIKNHFKIED